MSEGQGVPTPRTIPVSEQIAMAIRERIAAGELRPGDLIPSERQIVDEWRVAKMTAARAVARLKSEGLVETVPGRGVAVLDQRAGMSPSAQLARMRTNGRIRLGNERSELLEAGIESSLRVHPLITAAIGQTEESGDTLYRRRLILRDDQPMCVATSWIAAAALSPQPGWERVRERLLALEPIPQGTPMLIAEMLGEVPEREDYCASAEAAVARDAEALGVMPGSPVLQIVSTVHSEVRPLECGVYVYPAAVRCGFPSAEYSAA